MSLSVDVAIVAYRRWDLTRSCLDHLARQTRPHRVQLCDNGCDEGTAERVREEFPDVDVIRVEQNLPFAIACNHVVAAGHGDVVILLNNDVDAPPDFIERLVAPLEAEPTVGSVAAVLVRPGGEMIDSVGIVADPTLAPFACRQGHPPAESVTPSPLLAAPDGAAGAFRRKAWQQVGGMDEDLPLHEDFDVGVRVRNAGWGVALAPGAVAVHVRSATRGRQSAHRRHISGWGRAYILRRYGVLRSRFGLRALATEVIVVVGDSAISHDLAALRGRLAGWHAAAGAPARPRPDAGVIDHRISFADSLKLRMAVDERKAAR